MPHPSLPSPLYSLGSKNRTTATTQPVSIPTKQKTKIRVKRLTLPKSLRILRNNPVPRLGIDHLKHREELADERDDLVRDVLALGAADEQRGLEEAHGGRVLEGEVAQVVERLAQDAERDPELLGVGPVGRAVQVAEEELADCEGLGYHKLVGGCLRSKRRKGGAGWKWAYLLVWLEDLVGLGLASDAGLVNLLHALDVAAKVGVDTGVDGGVVDRDEVGDEVGLVEGERHGRFGAPWFGV